jgi:hypothetical protein
MPDSVHALTILTAISPRLAINIFFINSLPRIANPSIEAAGGTWMVQIAPAKIQVPDGMPLYTEILLKKQQV